MSSVALSYLFNTVLVFILVKGFARSEAAEAHPLRRVAALSLLFFFDACFLLWMDCHGRAIAYLVAVFCAASITFPNGQTAGLTRSLGTKRFAVYILSVFTVAALVYVYLPITTFLTSPGELSIHINYLITTNASMVMVVIYLAGALYGFAFSARLKSILALIALCSLVLTLVYAYVYPFGYPMLNGLMFEQVPITGSTLALRAVVDAATVVVGVVLSIVALERFGTKRVLVGIGVINLSLVLASIATIVKDRPDIGTKAKDSAAAENAQPIRYSRSKDNVLILFLDRFMGGFVEGILKEEPQLASALEGFTWYPKTLAPGENSIAGVHAMLGGYDYTARQMNLRKLPLRDISVESFAILPYNFTKKGWAANLVSPHGLGFTMDGDCSFLDIKGLNCTHIPPSVTKELADQYHLPSKVLTNSMYADLLVLLGLMRGMPYMMREIMHEKGPWRPFLDHSAGTTFRQWAELKSLPKLSSVESRQSNINIVFNMLPHEPYFMGENCMPQTTQLDAPEAAMQHGFSNSFAYQHFVAARCALLLAADYMQWMKQAGVYDNTKVVIVSDHGIVGPVDDHSSRAVAGGTTDSNFVRSRSVLFVKSRNAHGPLRVGDDFLPNAEVPRIACEEIGGCVNPYLNNKSIAPHGRDQPFFVDFVPWQFNLQEPTAFKIQGEMVLDGRDPYVVENWRRKTAPASRGE